MIVLEREPETQAQPGFPPPRPPQRTAVGTDDDEKRPCKWCGHTKAQHLSGTCRAQRSLRETGGDSPFCGCPRWKPKED